MNVRTSPKDCYKTTPKLTCVSCFLFLSAAGISDWCWLHITLPFTGWTYWNGNKPKRKLFNQRAAVTYLHLSIVPAYHSVQYCSNSYGTVLFYSNWTSRWEIQTDVDWMYCILRPYKHILQLLVWTWCNIMISLLKVKVVISVVCKYWRRNGSRMLPFMVTMLITCLYHKMYHTTDSVCFRQVLQAWNNFSTL